MPTFLGRLRRLWPGSAGRSAQALAASIREQSSSIDSLTRIVRSQSQQIKALGEAVKEQDRRWQTIVDRMTARQASEIRDIATAQQRRDRGWQEAIDGQSDRQRRDAKWRASFARQLSAVVRRLCLPADLPHPFDLAARRFQLRSQFEEDGIVLALLERVGVTTRRFVEIGCGRSGGNSATLALDCGWEGLMIDGSGPAIDKLRQQLAINPRVTATCAMVLPENVNDLLSEHGYTGEVDVLSLDIDSYDYWVLDALHVCSPRVLITEYNAAFGGTRAVTIPYPQPLQGTPKGYHGASLGALVLAARRKGYRLVLCDESGVNAFFVRHDLAPELPELPLERAFKPALSRVDFGQEVPDRNVYQLAAAQGLPLIDV
jgi:hypothetical protein